MSTVTRRGWTLHEMLISLVVMSGVMALAAQLALGQLRFFRSSAELATLRRDASQASGIAAGVLRGISPADGDVEVALDSAIEVHMSIGTALACSSSPGVVSIPAASEPAGNTVASFAELPEPGDRMYALHTDSVTESWSLHVVAESSPSQSGCAAIQSAATRLIRIEDPATFAPATPLRFTRPVRLSLYRSADRRWYLGARDWSAESRRFNTIQPVAGPLRPYDSNAGLTGLRFVYRDVTGIELAAPVERTRIAMVTVVARASSGQFSDSSIIAVALRTVR